MGFTPPDTLNRPGHTSNSDSPDNPDNHDDPGDADNADDPDGIDHPLLWVAGVMTDQEAVDLVRCPSSLCSSPVRSFDAQHARFLTGRF